MKTLSPNIEKLINGTCDRIGQHADASNVLAALVQGKLTDVPRPPGVPLDAVRGFRKRNKRVRRQFVEHVFVARRQTALPGVAEPVAGTVAQAPAPIQPVQSVALAEIARQTSLELKEIAGEIFITLRSFEKLIGKTPENLRRTLDARGFPLTDIPMPNAIGNTRSTPAIHVSYVFAVVALADLHGMDTQERERLFALQRELPTWMKRFEASRALAAAPKTDLPTHIMGDRGRRVPLAALVSTIADKVVMVVSDFAHRLDIRLDRIERLLTPKTLPVIASSGLGGAVAPAPNGAPKYPSPPNKFGTTRPFISAEQLLERFDKDFAREQRNMGIDSPQAVDQLARNLGIFKTQHWGRPVRNDEWEYDAGPAALTSYSYMLDFLRKNIVARNSQPTSFS